MLSSHRVLGWYKQEHVVVGHASDDSMVTLDIIQLMHSFEVNIRICQPENSDVHRGDAEVNITFEG